MEVTQQMVWDALRTIPDPEFGINIVDMGLIYSVESKENNDIHVIMTLTTENCPSGAWIYEGAKTAVNSLEDVGEVQVDMVFDPPWTIEMLSEEGKAQLGFA